ncbi:MAG: hypothetical protein AAGA48_08370 [Myxococcota bacterium]
MAHDFARLTTIARKLEYLSRTDLIGRTVYVTGSAHRWSSVREQLPVGEVASSIDPSINPLALAKYGILEFQWPVTAEAADHETAVRVPWRTLLGRGDGSEEFEPEVALWLDDVVTEVTSGQLWFKLILDALADGRDSKTRLKHTSTQLPGSYWPRSFKVRDACITNAPTLWLFKHFYL